MNIGNIENIEKANLNTQNKLVTVNKSQEANIDLKNNSQSNFTESLSRNKKMDSKEIKENEIINKLASKNLEANYEQKINNTDFTFDSESQSFISRIKNENNLVLAQYPTEEMIRLKIYMNNIQKAD
jgi:hypothetical protein